MRAVLVASGVALPVALLVGLGPRRLLRWARGRCDRAVMAAELMADAERQAFLLIVGVTCPRLSTQQVASVWELEQETYFRLRSGGMSQAEAALAVRTPYRRAGRRPPADARAKHVPPVWVKSEG